jgi:hypothetical protein
MAIKSFTTKQDADGNYYRINRESCTFTAPSGKRNNGAVWTADYITADCVYTAVKVRMLSDYVESYKAGRVRTGSEAAGRVVYAPIRRQDVLEAMGL